MPIAQGFTLLEVLVALLIFSVGLLGLAGMQIHGAQNTRIALVRSIAVQQAYDMAERIRSNRAGVLAGDYDNLNIIEVTCAANNSCSPTTHIHQYDFQVWNNSVTELLPSGHGVVENQNSTLTVTIHWDEGHSGGSATMNCPPTQDTDLACYQLTVIP